MNKKLTLFDGAMGTVLNELGLMSECNELLNLEQPEVIKSIHKDYAASGSEFVKTNTFGASPLKLRRSGNDGAAFDINKAALTLAKLSGVKAAGDIGPSGELYFPYGSVSTFDIYNSYLVQAMALKDADAILIETMSSLVEANLAYLAVRNFNKNIPIIMSFTFDNGYTMMGCTPELIAKATNSLDIYAIGTNCSGGPKELLSVVRALSQYSVHKVCAMPNAGLPILDGEKVTYPFGADQFAKAMINIIEAGAEIIGGCCGTTSEHIAALNALDIVPSRKYPEIEHYCATEREFMPIAAAVDCIADLDEILKIEESGAMARIDLRYTEISEDYFNDFNMLSSRPKCFKAKPEQELMIRLLYQGITDIVITD
jgi:5-methyltetrahydrofolate--homocysteine methyltransferase